MNSCLVHVHLQDLRTFKHYIIKIHKSRDFLPDHYIVNEYL